jgi:hypothetical protein
VQITAPGGDVKENPAEKTFSGYSDLFGLPTPLHPR